MTRRLTSGHLLYVLTLAAAAVGLAIIAVPDKLPDGLTWIGDQLSAVSVTVIAVVAAGTLLLFVIFREFAGGSITLDRSAITDTPPEPALTAGEGKPDAALTTAYHEVHKSLTNPDQHDRRIAMYGRRAVAYKPLPEEYDEVFDELAITARDSYLTTTTTRPDAAERAIETGTWTDDRIAAAFLATDPDADVSFLRRERILAWLTPQETFERRVGRTLSAIETKADTYLTYESSTTDTEDGTRSSGVES